VVGVAHAELLEEDLRHRLVVVLAGVHQHVLELVAALGQAADDRRDLHEVGPRAHDREDSAAACGHRITSA
jgi:hypothetical protein